MTPPPAEFALLAACCRPPADSMRGAAIAAAAAVPVDWERFERLVARHRVTALVADGLSSCGAVPVPVRHRLAAAAGAGAAQALSMAAETLRLQRLFDAAELPAYVVKGIPLARLAYGNMALKEQRDIDLVTSRAHLRAAAALLEGAGYEREGGEAPLTEPEMALLDAFAKHRGFRHPVSGHLVELHFRLQLNPSAFADLGEPPPLQDVPLGGGAVRTLAPDLLHAYLCVHGGGHAWERLKWLADLAALLATTQADLTALHGRARALGAGRASAVALALCADLLGQPVPEAILGEARASVPARLMLRLCRNAVREEREDPRHREGRILRQRACQLLLVQSPGYVRHELAGLLASETDARALRLPPPLRFLYPVMRVPNAAWRALRRRSGG
ncbi:MAG: nucleotidyltransferase family protein [Pseudomonadota bacterium]